MYYRSKKDIWFSSVYLALLLLLSWQIIIYNKSGLLFIISALIVGFMLWIWFGTGYTIEKGLIRIKSGPFRKTIKIEEIKHLGTTKISFMEIGLLVGPSLSINRLEIMYGEYNNVMNISPQNVTNFIKTLSSENPQIQIDKSLFDDRNN